MCNITIGPIIGGMSELLAFFSDKAVINDFKKRVLKVNLANYLLANK